MASVAEAHLRMVLVMAMAPREAHKPLVLRTVSVGPPFYLRSRPLIIRMARISSLPRTCEGTRVIRLCCLLLEGQPTLLALHKMHHIRAREKGLAGCLSIRSVHEESLERLVDKPLGTWIVLLVVMAVISQLQVVYRAWEVHITKPIGILLKQKLANRKE